MSNSKVILAYSGGLDTSCILKWLLEKKFQVVCYVANVGQQEDFNEIEKKALSIGASKVIIDDLRELFVKDYIWPAIQAGVIYEKRYLLGTSLARPCISVGLIKAAKDNNAEYIAHGATGKGNDQIRFELSCYFLWPEIKIIAPWRLKDFTTKFNGRSDLLKYAAENNIPVSATPKAPWSMDANLMHISYESGLLEDPFQIPPKNLYQFSVDPQLAPDIPYNFEINFNKGLPSSIVLNNGKLVSEPLEMFLTLNKIGSENGIGRIDIVENRFVGLKSRGVYETPGGHILYVAHTDLEIFCLDKEIFRTKQLLSDRLSDYIYNGFWFSPEVDYLRKCITISQETVNGTVKVQVYKGNVFILGRSSNTSVYNKDLVSMDKHDEFNPEDASGYINILSIRVKEYSRFLQRQE